MIDIKERISNLSKNQTSIIMLIVTVLCPITISGMGWGGDSEGNHWVDLAIVAVLWTFFPVSGNWNPMGFGVQGYGFFFLNPIVIYNTFPIWFLSIMFAIQVVRYRTGNALKRKTLQLGILSIIPPSILGFIGYIGIVQAGLLIYSGPIPIQLIVGYVLMRYSDKWKADLLFEKDDVPSWWEEEKTE
ncbi:MAG: hypothetical protein PVG65_02590 [Candidatus Thorarchaeota archaeon]|jgi:hypothetical protein